MTESERSGQKGVLVACQGTRGAYAQIAAAHLFPDGQFLYFKNFRAVARAVSAGMCRYGVLPIENNTYGSVRDVYRVIGSEQVSVVRGFTLKIEHVLLARKNISLGDITTVCSHEQALGQCSEFLHGLGDKVRIMPCLNTAVAARYVAESPESGAAAIASPECASLYGLNVIRKNIADSDSNYTRFICVSKEPEILPGANRISIMFTLPHRPGSLAHVLSLFADAGINLLKIESEPIPGKEFEFRFYIDLDAAGAEESAGEILARLARECPSCRFLGQYTEEV